MSHVHSTSRVSRTKSRVGWTVAGALLASPFALAPAFADIAPLQSPSSTESFLAAAAAAEEPPVGFSDLDGALRDALAVDRTLATDPAYLSLFLALDQAITVGQTVRANASSTQQHVDDATQALSDAIWALHLAGIEVIATPNPTATATATSSPSARVVSQAVTIPADVEAGNHHIQVRDAAGVILAQFAVIVRTNAGTSPRQTVGSTGTQTARTTLSATAKATSTNASEGQLPDTGSSTSGLIAAASLLAVVGAGLMLAFRRRTA